MRKRNRKLMSILLTLSLLAAMLVPMAAYAGTTYEQVTTRTFDPDVSSANNVTLGTFMIDIDPLSDTSSALVEVVDSNGKRLDINGVEISQEYSDSVGSIVYERAGNDNKAYKLTLTPGTNAGEEFKWVMAFKVDGSDAAAGDISVKISKLSGHLFSGTVVVGKATGGEVSAEVLDVKSINEDGGDVTIRLTETVGGSLEASSKSVKLTLPSGFEWRNPSADVISGDVDIDEVKDDGRYLYVNVDTASGIRSIVDINVSIDVDDSKAAYGDINVSVSGDSDMSTSSLVVAKYGDYGVTVSAEGATTVVAGMLEQEIGTIVVEEDSPGSLSEGKSITLTLPSNAVWYEYPDVEEDNIDIDNDVVSASGTDGRTIKYVVNDASEGEVGKIEFKNGKVHLACNATGDFKIEVGGSAGAEGEATVATVEPAVNVTANVTEVKIGSQNQAAGDIEIVESKAEAINDDNDLIVQLPSGIEFQGTPDVDVVEGDLDIENDNIDVDEGTLTIPVSGTSTTASKIKISNIEYKVDRTVAEGDVQVKIGGGALNEVNDQNELENLYPNFDGTTYNPSEDSLDGDFTFDEDGIFPSVEWAVKVVNAKCVTPAPEGATYETVFKIGDTKYTVNGVEKTMDVAPYIKGDRTYLPIRFAAYAAGVVDANIMWNQADQSVILIKGDRVVKMVIGNTTMFINGVPFTMDVAPEIVDPGRTMLPIRYVAQALGCEVTWDDATQSVTVK